jgi:RNA polymerase sigma-70 factor (ECF subfamily)
MDGKRRRSAAADRPDALAAAPGGDERMAAAVARGRAAHPELDLDEATFARRLAQLAGNAGAPLDALAVEDLFLACACVAGARGAAAEVQRRYRPEVRGAIARVVTGPDAVDIEQRLWVELLTASDRAPPKIAGYAGQAPLGRWLSVAAQRTALNWVRSSRAEARARKGAGAEPVHDTPPEVAFIKDRYRLAFEQALGRALANVSDRDRALLRLHLVNGLSMERAGQMFGVSQPTASRWLAAARDALLDDVKATLHAELRVSSLEMKSLADLVASRLDLSLSELLKTG